MKKTDPPKVYNVEFIRIAFSLIIVYYHILHSNIIPYTDGLGLYVELQQHHPRWAAPIVDCFLIMGGYFLYQSEKLHAERPLIEVFWDRLARLWPVFAFYVMITFVFYDRNLEKALFEISMLHCTGISLEYKGIIWYISPYFWASFLIVATIRGLGKKRALLLLGMVSYLGYCVNINSLQGNLGREVVFSFLSLGFVRVLSGLALGTIIAASMEEFEVHFGRSTNSVLWTTIELVITSFLVWIFAVGTNKLSNMFIVLIAFIPLFVSFINGAGLLGRLLNRKIFATLGKYAYSTYVMQQISFNILKVTLWKHTHFLTTHVFLTLLISVAFAALVGAATYHLVERPCLIQYQRRKLYHNGPVGGEEASKGPENRPKLVKLAERIFHPKKGK